MKVHTAARLARIAATLTGYSLVPAFRSLISGDYRRLALSLSRAFEKLGPAFIKVGQLLSVRPDIVGEKQAQIFGRLLDRAAPMDFITAKAIVERELVGKVEGLFLSFDQNPVASASVSQVHRAFLPSGEEVAVKIQRPKARELLTGDAVILRGFASLLQRGGFLKNRVNLRGFFDEVVRSCESEVDFRKEAEVSARFARNFAKGPSPVIPKVFWSHTTSKVLTTSYIHGVKISDARARRGAGYPSLAEEGALFFLRQALDHGLFHADLHPANILITDDGKIAYLDFGIYGELSPEERHAILGTLSGMLAGDAHLALRHLKALGVFVPPGNEAAFVNEIAALMEEARKKSLGEINVRKIGFGIMGAVRSHKVSFPHKYALLIKALLTVEGSARTLHSGFDLSQTAKRHLLSSVGSGGMLSVFAQTLWRGGIYRGVIELGEDAGLTA